MSAAAGEARAGAAPRWHGIDALRGFAALYVVLFHYTFRFAELYGFPVDPALRIADGVTGVEVFFVISGFVIPLSLARFRRARDFVVARATRILPAYWIAVALTFTVVCFAPLPGRTTAPWEALVNLSMLQELLNVPAVDGVYWSLTVELLFYFWIYLLWTSASRRPVVLAVLWMGVALLVEMMAREMDTAAWRYLAKFIVAPWTPFFCAGLIAWHAATRATADRESLLGLGLATLLAAMLHGATAAIVVAATSATLMLIAAGHLRWLRARPLVFMGTISYPLYLLHQNIGYVALRGMLTAGIPTDAAILIAVAGAIGLAALVTFAAEQPLIRRLRQGWAAHPRIAPLHAET